MIKAVLFDINGVFLSCAPMADVLRTGVTKVQNTELIDLTVEVKKKGVKIFGLSNNVDGESSYEAKYPELGKVFDRIYISTDTGFYKPEPMAYKNVLQENGLKPEECLFFDDLKENVTAAKALGIGAYFYTGVEATKKAMEENDVM